jgi:hypothetical protein
MKLRDFASKPMRSKFITIGVSAVVGAILFVSGYFTAMFTQRNPSAYAVNSLGGQMLEMNRLYARLHEQGVPIKHEWKRYNLDMLLTLDCGSLFKSLTPTINSPEYEYLFKGLAESKASLAKVGVSTRQIETCNGFIGKWLNQENK